MHGIALTSAPKGRLRPSFFFLLCAVAASAMAQQAVFRCGQEYTNAPRDPDRCERVASQAITVIPGTRVPGVRPAAPVAPAAAFASAPPAGQVASVVQQQRDDMARNIVSAELEQARQRHAQLLQEYQQGEPVRSPDEVQNPKKYQERVARLKASVDRAQRDIDSLQRELARRPLASVTP